ncbi:hypothetical protein OIU76_017926 [Salix suchowensis]|nr:hypothetical protein OIU76_017926 [Salix suchowensis]
MLYLDTIDDSKRMYLYINGPGGDLTPSLSIYDTMQSLKSPVGTHCVGFAYNLAGFLLTAGEKGNRSAMPLSRIALQSPAGAARGQADDIRNEANELLRIRDYLYNELSKKTGQPFEKISKDLSRMKRFEAQDALEYGLIDRIIRPPRIDDDVGPSDASVGLAKISAALTLLLTSLSPPPEQLFFSPSSLSVPAPLSGPSHYCGSHPECKHVSPTTSHDDSAFLLFSFSPFLLTYASSHENCKGGQGPSSSSLDGLQLQKMMTKIKKLNIKYKTTADEKFKNQSSN